MVYIPVGYSTSQQPLIDNIYYQGCIVDPNYMIPQNGTVTAFKAFLDWERAPHGEVNFMVLRPLNATKLSNNSYIGANITTKVITQTGYKGSLMYNNGTNEILLSTKQIANVTRGDILALCYRYGANPVPYTNSPPDNFCDLTLYSHFTNSSLPMFTAGSNYNWTVTNTVLHTCRSYAFQALIRRTLPVTNTSGKPFIHSVYA